PVVDHRRAAAPALGAVVKWVLPEYVEDILPAEAMRIEKLRRAILDLFFEKEYELVMPPLLEYMDSLLTGTGQDLELRTFKLIDLRLDIGHVAVFRSIARAGRIGAELEGELFGALQKKDLPELRGLSKRLDAKTRSALQLLPELYGGAEVLDAAEKKLPKLPELAGALKTLRALAKACPVSISFDLAELRGYHYHSGVVFAAYSAGVTRPVAAGGRE